MGQLTVVKQFFVNFDLFRDTQAIRHLDDVHAVKESLIVFVVTEGHPFRFVRVGKNDPVKRQGGNTFRPVVVPLLGQILIPMVDIGLAQLAMHSSMETASCIDAEYMARAVAEFYNTPISQPKDGEWKLGL